MADEIKKEVKGLKIIKDGKIAGWVFASIATILYEIAWVYAFIDPVFTDKMERLGGNLNVAYLTIIGVWMATKTVKSVVQTTTENMSKTKSIERVRDPNTLGG